MWKLNGKLVLEGRPWTNPETGISYPLTWGRMSDDDKIAAGLVWEDPAPNEAPFDKRFYWGREADGTLIPKNIEDVVEVDAGGNQITTLGLKSIWKDKVKDMALSRLANTDWMVLRYVEDGTTIPTQVANRRSVIRAKATSITQAINQCTTIAEFKALFETPVDQNGNPTGNPVIGDWGDEE